MTFAVLSGVMPATPAGTASVGYFDFTSTIADTVEVRFPGTSAWVPCGATDLTRAVDPATQAGVKAKVLSGDGWTRLRLTYGPTSQLGDRTFQVRVTESYLNYPQVLEFSVTVRVYEGSRSGTLQALEPAGSQLNGDVSIAALPGGDIIHHGTLTGTKVTYGGTTYTAPQTGVGVIARLRPDGTAVWVRFGPRRGGTGERGGVVLGPDGVLYLGGEVSWNTASPGFVFYTAQGTTAFTVMPYAISSSNSGFVAALTTDGTWVGVSRYLLSGGRAAMVATGEASFPIVLAGDVPSGGVRVNDATVPGSGVAAVWLTPALAPAAYEFAEPGPQYGSNTRAAYVRDIAATPDSDEVVVAVAITGSKSLVVGDVSFTGTKEADWVVRLSRHGALGSALMMPSYVTALACTPSTITAIAYAGSGTTSLGHGVSISRTAAGYSLVEFDRQLVPKRAHTFSDGTQSLSATDLWSSGTHVWAGVTLKSGSTTVDGKAAEFPSTGSAVLVKYAVGGGGTQWVVPRQYLVDAEGDATGLLYVACEHGYAPAAGTTLRNSDGTVAYTWSGTYMRTVLASLSPDGFWSQGVSDAPAPPHPSGPQAPQWTAESTTAWPTDLVDGEPAAAVLECINPDAAQGDVPPPPDPDLAVLEPGMVTNVAAVALDGAVALSWDQAEYATDGYMVFQYVSDSGYEVERLVGSTKGTSFVVRNLTNDQPAKVAVSAVGHGVSVPTVIMVTPSSSGASPESLSYAWAQFGIQVRAVGGAWKFGNFATPVGVMGTVQSGSGSADLPALSAGLTFTPASAALTGQVRFEARAVAVTVSGQILYSSTLLLETTYTSTAPPPVIDPPSVSAGQIDTSEDTQADVICTATGQGPLVWQLASSDTGAGAGSGVTVYSDNGPVAGTASIVSGQGTESLRVRFTPFADWNGAASFYVRASGAGGPSGWEAVSVSVTPVADAPSAPVPTTVPDFDEDGYIDFTLLMPDVDQVPGEPPATGTWELQFSDLPTGPWRTDRMVAPTFSITSLDTDSSDQAATLRIEGAANWSGTYAFYVRVKDTSDDPPLYSPVTQVTGRVVSANDAPGAPTPTRMPLAKPGSAVTQTFSTFDPDGPAPYTWSIAATAAGPWASTLTIAGAGTVTVVRQSDAAATADVEFSPQATDGPARYRFYIRVSDGAGGVSPATLVTGAAAGPELAVYLQRLSRTSSGASLSTLCPLTTITQLQFSESLDGPGGASLTVSAAEVARRAHQLGITSDWLLDPGSVEVVIRSGLTEAWVGPIESHSFDAGSGLVSIEARGLLAYLETRELESERAYINAEQATEIVWPLIAAEQAKSYGSLLFTNGTAPTGQNRSLTLGADLTVAGALTQVSEQPDGCEIWVGPDRVVHAALARGTDKRSSILVTSGQVQSASRAVQPDWVATVVIVDGDQESGTPAASGTAVDTVELAKRGRIVRRISAPSLMTSASCKALAEQVLASSKAPLSSYRVSIFMDPARPWAATDVSAGDVIRLCLEDQHLGMVDEAVRVVSKAVRVVSRDSVTVELEVESAKFDSSGRVLGRYARGRWRPEVFESLYDALYR